MNGFPSSWSPCILTSMNNKKRCLRFQICKIWTQLSFRSTHLLCNWHVPVSHLSSNSPSLRVAFLPLQKSSVPLEVLSLSFYLFCEEKNIQKGCLLLVDVIHQLTFTIKIGLLNVLKGEKPFPKYTSYRQLSCKIDTKRASPLSGNEQLLSLSLDL